MIEVFHSSRNKANKARDLGELQEKLVGKHSIKHVKTNSNHPHTYLDLTNIVHVPSSGTHSGSNAMLYVFEDNEAVIKMIISGRSPTVRHVSRTHKVALDWLFDRINLRSLNSDRIH